MDTATLRTRLLALDTSCLCDARKTLRTLDSDIRPIVAGVKMVGRAFTVPCCDDFLRVLKALRDAQPGDVLVVDGQGGRKALAGELFATEARRRGLAGIVVDGAVRDVATIRLLGFPVYSRGITPMAGAMTSLSSSLVPVSCGGVTVAAGDFIIGDDDGVVVGSEAELAEIVPAAEEIQRQEAEVLRRLATGQSLFTMLNVDEHLEAVGSGKKSKLRFIL
jgi:4-hydroxy-4-methyl-2-oxoglutarate aldolase